MTSYAARVNLPGLTLEVTAFVQPSCPPEMAEDMPELCSMALVRFKQLADQNAQLIERRASDDEAARNALRSVDAGEAPKVVDPWGTDDDGKGDEPPC